jgi:hypothetical protein
MSFGTTPGHMATAETTSKGDDGIPRSVDASDVMGDASQAKLS